MSIRGTWRWAGGVGVVVVVACSSSGPSGLQVELQNFSVMLRNGDIGGDPVTISAEDESSGAGGPLSAGGSRGYLVDNMECGIELCTLRFTANRGATVLQTATCSWAPRDPPADAYVVWDGTNLLCVNWGLFGEVSWQLVSITGSTTGNWEDEARVATGTLTFNPPKIVTEGNVHTVSATFAATVTALPGWCCAPGIAGPQTGLSVGIVDRGVPGLVLNQGGLIGRAEPVATASVTVTGTWSIPRNATTLSIEAGGGVGVADLSQEPLNVVATYSKNP